MFGMIAAMHTVLCSPQEEAMAELKTQPTGASVQAFIDAIPDARKRQDAAAVLALMAEVTGDTPQMWGSSMVGFGRYHYTYASGREGEWFLTGFAPRKQNLTLYIMAGFAQHDELLAKLGKHTTGQSCLYVKKLADIDLGVLRQLVELSVAHMMATNPSATNSTPPGRVDRPPAQLGDCLADGRTPDEARGSR
jgi:hypothetical protein